MTTQAQFFRALGDARRLRIAGALLEGELDAGQLAAVAGRDASTVSRHLRVLVEAGILRRRRDGRRIIYAIANAEMAGRLRRVGVAPPVAPPKLDGRIRDFLASQ
uniref:Putative bacterial regulatory protein, arsR family protein n=1 Tax=uncultured marine microorganism HF4000_ANIW137J11 TaxID=455532 RepID=B3T4P6_9ZZZZ|nr:putative bacterial regulatory protein, arsR family protein [uncultured marine microorganism HF4000_ANIW137J11]